MDTLKVVKSEYKCKFGFPHYRYQIDLGKGDFNPWVASICIYPDTRVEVFTANQLNFYNQSFFRFSPERYTGLTVERYNWYHERPDTIKVDGFGVEALIRATHIVTMLTDAAIDILTEPTAQYRMQQQAKHEKDKANASTIESMKKLMEN